MTQPALKRVALLVAMRDEALPMIQALGLIEDAGAGDPALPLRHYRGKKGRLELMLSLNGQDPRHRVESIGTGPAALNAYVTIGEFRPQLIINAGTAGGFVRRGGKIGDVYLSQGVFRFHDRRIPIPGYDEYGIGSHPSCEVSAMAARLGLKLGNVSTGDSLDFTPQDMEAMDRHQCAVKEMEAASIAWVAGLFDIPFFAIKSVTDLVDGGHPTQKEFLENLTMASRNLGQAVLKVLEDLEAHPLGA